MSLPPNRTRAGGGRGRGTYTGYHNSSTGVPINFPQSSVPSANRAVMNAMAAQNSASRPPLMQTPQPPLHSGLPIYHHAPSQLFPITPQVLGSAPFQRTNILSAGASNQPHITGQNPDSNLLPGQPSVPPIQQPTSISTPQGMYPVPMPFGSGAANQLPPHFAALPATELFPSGPQQYGMKQPMFIPPQPLPQQQPPLQQQAIKIINPETKQEVNPDNTPSNSRVSSASSSSSRLSDLADQQGQQQQKLQGVERDHSVQLEFKERVLGTMGYAPMGHAPNAIIKSLTEVQPPSPVVQNFSLPHHDEAPIGTQMLSMGSHSVDAASASLNSEVLISSRDKGSLSDSSTIEQVVIEKHKVTVRSLIDSTHFVNMTAPCQRGIFADNRWVRPDEVENDLPEDERETKRIFRKFLGILNKLTPQKFKDLAEQALCLPLSNMERLNGCVDMLFEKALREPLYSVVYANLCRVMSPIKVIYLIEQEEMTTTFRREVLSRCQREFEKDRRSNDEMKAMQEAVETAETPELKRKHEEALELLTRTAWKRFHGCICFIGEIFKLKMLSEIIIHDCMVRLLRSSSDEESIECFCRLIITTGKDMDHKKAKELMDKYFLRIEEIRTKKKISPRLKFMLQDVQETRKNNWVPRRLPSSLKTINQIHREAQQEHEQEQEWLKHGSKGSVTSEQQDELRKDVGRRPNQKVDVSRLQGILRKGKDQKEPTTLAPGSGFRPGGSPWNIKPVTASPPPEQPKSGKLESSKVPLRSKNESAVYVTKHLNQPEQAHQQQKLHAAQQEAPNVAITKQSCAIIDQLTENSDYKEALVYVHNLKPPNLMNVFIREGIFHAMNSSLLTRTTTGRLLHLILLCDVMSLEQMSLGLSEVLELSEDLEVDIPLFWDYFAECVCMMVAEASFPLSSLAPLAVKGCELKAPRCVAKVIAHCAKLTSPERASKLWAQSGLSWTELGVDDSNIVEFLETEAIEFLQVTASQDTDEQRFLIDFVKLLRTDRVDDILSFIEKRKPQYKRKSSQFVRTFAEAAIRASTNEAPQVEFNGDRFRTLSILLNKYADEDGALQVEVLNAAQVTVAKLNHPPGLLHNVFYHLYDVETVKESAFFDWLKRGTEDTGRSVALQSVKGFFDSWLENADPESDNESGT